MRIWRVLVAGALVFAACSADPGFDRASEDFVVTIEDLALAEGESLAFGFHPTEAPAEIGVGAVVGRLLVCPVDSLGVLMPGLSVEVPPCREVRGRGVLPATDGTLHAAVGFRTTGTAASESMTLSYRQADGYFAVFYTGRPRALDIIGPPGASPWLTNFGEVAVSANGVAVDPGMSVQIGRAAVSIELVSGTKLDIDWFGERTPFLP